RCMVLHKTADEGAHLGTRVVVVEDITETDRLTQELMHSERLASTGRLAAGVAHEIGNPVTGIACLAQNLRDHEPGAAVAQATRDILTQTQRISRIVQSLVSFAHSGRTDSQTLDEPVHLHHCVHEAIELLKLNKAARPIDWQNACDTRI